MLAQIRMEQMMAVLGHHTTKPRQEISQPNAEVNMRQTSAQMFIQTTKPVVYIDQTEAFADAGSKKVTRLIAEYAAKGRQAALEGIARITQEGLTLRGIEAGTQGKQIKQIAQQRFNKPLPVSQMDFIPRYGSVKIQGVPGSLQINWRIGGVEMNPVIHRPMHNYRPGGVEFYMAQRNNLNIWVEPNVNARL